MLRRCALEGFQSIMFTVSFLLTRESWIVFCLFLLALYNLCLFTDIMRPFTFNVNIDRAGLVYSMSVTIFIFHCFFFFLVFN